MRFIFILSLMFVILFTNGCEKDSKNDVENLGTPDLIVKSLVVTEKTSTSIAYEYTIKNIGNGAANMDGKTANWNLAIQAYLSTDSSFDNSDLPAGGTILGTSLGYLEINEELSGSFGCGFTKDVSQYSYLLLKIDQTNIVSESNEENNIFSCKFE